MSPTRWITGLSLTLSMALAGTIRGEQLETFTEPYTRVAVPAAEVGVIDQILVREGDLVTRHQLLAQLDDRVLKAGLEVARAAKDSLGAKLSAEAELNLRKSQLQSYRELNAEGNASSRELERAESEYQQSAARLQGVNEDLEIRRLEFARVQAQLQQRRIESPIDGHVIAIDKQVGEFVSPNDPILMHIVQLQTLKAVFSVPQHAASELAVGQTVRLLAGVSAQPCSGVIEFVSPVVNPESAAVSVKIRIDNPDRTIGSGWTCRWDLNGSQPPQRTTRVPALRQQR